MGKVHDSYGPNQIAVEERDESFYVHPGYGYSASGRVQSDAVTEGGERIERPHFARHWREGAHPEFLLSDVPYLLRALADLPTCPAIVKSAVSLFFGDPDAWTEGLKGITPEEAEQLFNCYSGGPVDPDLLNAVTPKLEAIAGKELSA